MTKVLCKIPPFYKMKSNYLDIEGGECVKKKMCFLIVLLFAGGCFVTPYDFVSAEEL
ncbi:hypothetical protein MOD24_03295 [Bacillus haynesii]|uniref:hypothetical protein n=1 Tax=Bacillus haynesii TaxID=1925021 RepID=UPI00227EE617|nr:hypothetical protein [Bacillus haynesii]MCY8574886.1 hypothetical protein [Bacillus haynesii]